MNKELLQNLGLLILRVGLSAFMLTHGLSKFQRLFADEIKFADPLGIGETPSLILVVIGEFIAPILIMIGFRTRLIALFPAITMLVAAFIVHGDDPFAKKEKALLYLLGYVVVILCGPGKYALDKSSNDRIF